VNRGRRYVGRIGSLSQHNLDVELQCVCGHASLLDSRDMLQAYGPDLGLGDLVRRARCGQCGARGGAVPMIRYRYWYLANPYLPEPDEDPGPGRR